MSWKTSFSPEENLIKQQAKEFAEALKSWQELVENFKDVYIRESQELLKALDSLVIAQQGVKEQSQEERVEIAETTKSLNPLPENLQKTKEKIVHKEERKALAEYLWISENAIKDINISSFVLFGNWMISSILSYMESSLYSLYLFFIFAKNFKSWFLGLSDWLIILFSVLIELILLTLWLIVALRGIWV